MTSKIKNKNRSSIIKGSDHTFNTIIVILLTVFLVIELYPIIFVVASSFSGGTAIADGRVFLWPVDVTLDGYRMVMDYKQLWIGLGNTLLYVFFGTIVRMFMNIAVAYPLSRRDMQGRMLYVYLLMVPMFIGGGMIPTFILVSKLGLVNTRLYMCMCGVSMGNVIILRTAMQSSVPEEVWESAKMDGCSYIHYLMRIMLPLVKASLSVLVLYSVVGEWNAYMQPLLYLRDVNKFPLQLFVQNILSTAKVDSSQMQDPELIAKLKDSLEVMRYALIVASTLPMILFYPFVQKFFEKGVMVGSVKG